MSDSEAAPKTMSRDAQELICGLLRLAYQVPFSHNFVTRQDGDLIRVGFGPPIEKGLNTPRQIHLTMAIANVLRLDGLPGDTTIQLDFQHNAVGATTGLHASIGGAPQWCEPDDPA